MKNTLKKAGFFGLMILFVSITSMGCRKKKDTIAAITVKNSAGAVVPGANVRLFPVPTPPGNGTLLWEFETTTNASGIATFNFNEVYQLGQAGVVVANIEAVYAGNTGTGVIKVDQETTSVATVFI
ncbi:hypothetical protein H9Y05_09685 [Crocinitomicaceae bacterium CZZ-1]|uniref:Uncharacterized protein n=1 Tax=Taishania pollutisoli TaxID=2766479 RepID=A0A8J6PJB2_9FLAO|nr:hypothetical protein [Taishania pollutisoli]MBC9812741.1 hypothetical protein [Taishania pollutisoli]MBX2949103.1 hypothetical protein [Crocinitomicaceae bacterium]NGF75967.1 hypothetical protein [Fluviicola sp. SGL-29]